MKNYKYFIEQLTEERVSSLDLAFSDYVDEVSKIIEEKFKDVDENKIDDIVSFHKDYIYDCFANNVDQDDCVDGMTDTSNEGTREIKYYH